MTTTTAFIVLCGALLVNGAFIRRPHLDGRIVGGSDANIEDHPYQLALLSDGFPLCGATILSEKWVITAAYCVYFTSLPSAKVRAGSNRFHIGGDLHQVKRIVTHEQYNHNTGDYDFALLRVEPTFEFGKRVQAIDMVDAEPGVGEIGVTSGWGFTSTFANAFAEHLQSALVPIVDRAVCKLSFHNYEVTPRMICAGMSENGDPCVGDEGGPLVVGGKLAGITAWGAGCGNIKKPFVYSNIANQREWIRERLGI